MNQSDHNTQGDLRGWFALAALSVFLLTIMGGLVLLGTGHWEEAKEFLGIVLPIEAALLFAAGRYYFGDWKGK